MARMRISLAGLPAWLRYLIAISVAAAVMYAAWRVGASRPEPAWLGPLRSIWTVLGPALIAYFVVRWLLRRKRK